MRFIYLYTLIGSALLLPYCGRPGKVSFDKAAAEHMPVEVVKPATGIPGTGNDSGPQTWAFHMKNRSSSAGTGLNAFYTVNAQKLASSDHFVIYRDVNYSAKMTTSDAQALLALVEPGYDKLKSVYGAGKGPGELHGGKIVILATDIKDDYNTTGSYIAGFVAPRDMYSDEFTRSLLSNVPLIDRYSNDTVATLAGRSNENTIIYIDLTPAFDGASHSGDTTKARQFLADTALHELSHLFTWYRRVILERLSLHDRWITEGLAESAPHLTASYTSTLEERLTQQASPSIQALLMQAPSLSDWNQNDGNLVGGGAITGYIQSTLFFYYLRHRAQTMTDAMLRSYMTETDSTITGLDNAISSYLSSQDTSSIFADWVLANYVWQGGKTLTNLVNESGATETLGSVSTAGTRAWQLSYSNIGKNGATSPAFKNAALPISYENVTCLKPLSYFVFRYTHNASNTNYITSGVFDPDLKGMHTDLRIILNKNDETDTNADLQIYRPDAASGVPFSTADRLYNLVVYNPNTSGDCLTTGTLPVDVRNQSKWIGGSKTGWQHSTGANWGNDRGFFYRPAGIAVTTKTGHSKTENYIYIADYINMGITRWNLDTGAFAGRLGSIATDCATDSSFWDGYTSDSYRFINNHCRRSFDEPRGVAVDSSANLYVADTQNMRIVKRTYDGDFVAWLGYPTDDTWQTLSDNAPISSSDMRAVVDYETDVKMVYLPWDVETDGTYLYYSSYGASRIVRRDLTTGAFEGFIGNGFTSWETATTSQVGHRNTTAGYLWNPKGITIQGSNLYIADEGNHRVVKWPLAGGTPEWVGGGIDGWGTHATAATSNKKGFHYPSDVSSDGTYLYITDRQNHRVSRWQISDGSFKGWIGGGKIQWEVNEEAPPFDPLEAGSSYPPGYFLEPQFTGIALQSQTGLSHDYLLTTSIYNGRLQRHNLQCYNDPINGDCTSD